MLFLIFWFSYDVAWLDMPLFPVQGKITVPMNQFSESEKPLDSLEAEESRNPVGFSAS